MTKYVYNEHDQSQVQEVLQARRRRRRRKVRKRAIFLLIACAIAAFFVSDISRIQSIMITGNDRVDTATIKKQIGIQEHKSISLLHRTSSMQRKINKMSGIASNTVVRKGLNTILITVQETSIVGYTRMGNILYIIDDKGDISKPEHYDETSVERSPQVFQMGEEQLRTFGREFVKIPSQVRNQVSDIIYAPTKGDATRLQFNMNDGKVLYVRQEGMARQLSGNRYSQVIRDAPDGRYYDFVGNDKVYIHN